MTYLEACRILGVDETTDEIEIKKRYRQLMKEAHPDTQAFIGKEETGEGGLRRTGYSAEEINAAYERLCQAEKKKKRTRNKKSTPVYHAPENQNAFCKRKILHTAEGAGGENIGDFVVAEGKYLWIQEEDFKMFLKSLYLCGKELLDDRLYYVVIPLLENRSVKVKIQVSQRQEEQGKTRFGRQTKFLYLDFWIKFPKEECRSAIESTSLKIEDLLRKYREG